MVNCTQPTKEQNWSYFQNYPDLAVIFAFHHTLFSDITQRNQPMIYFHNEKRLSCIRNTYPSVHDEVHSLPC